MGSSGWELVLFGVFLLLFVGFAPGLREVLATQFPFSRPGSRGWRYIAAYVLLLRVVVAAISVWIIIAGLRQLFTR